MADLSQFGKSKGKPQLSPYQEGVSKALKQSGEQHASEALMNGIPPQHIEQQAGLVDPQTLQQLSQLANMQMPMKGDGSFLGNKVGVLPAILKTLTGTPTSPFATKTQSLGLDNAIQVAGFQQTANKNSMDEQKFPYELSKLKTDTAQAKMNLRQSQPEFKQQELAAEESIKANAGAQQENLKQFYTTAKQSNNILTGLNALQKATVDLGDFNTGVLAQVSAKGKASIASFSKDPKYVNYLSNLNRELNRFARTYGQEKGMVSDKDIERYRIALTDITTPLAQKLDALHEIKQIMKSDVMNSAEIAGLDEKALQKINPTLHSQLSKIGSGKGTLMVDASGNRAYVYPDGTLEEL